MDDELILDLEGFLDHLKGDYFKRKLKFVLEEEAEKAIKEWKTK